MLYSVITAPNQVIYSVITNPSIPEGLLYDDGTTITFDDGSTVIGG
jgi:hypothetical protein